MKKAFLALAVAAALPAVASAQTNIQLYGSLDQSIEMLNKGANVGGTSNMMRLTDGIWGGSRLGVKGSEDIGGGIKGIFQFEHRFSADTGAANANFWNGQSWVGLGGGFGEIRMGRGYTPVFDAVAPADQTGYSWYTNGIYSTAVFGAGGTTGVLGVNNSIRWGNMVRYASPSLFGIKFVAAYSFGESNAGTTTAGAYDNAFGLAASGVVGPVGVGVGYQAVKLLDGQGKDTAIVGGLAGMVGQWGVGFAGGQEKKSTGAKNLGMYASAKGGVGPGNAYLGFFQNKATPVVGEAVTTRSIGLTYAHGLSKRTFVYATFGADLTKKAEGDTSERANKIAIGARHFF